VLDSRAPTAPLRDYLSSEGRFDRTLHEDDAVHAGLLHAAEADAAHRWRLYQQLAGLPAAEPDTTPGTPPAR
jgi:hypothetical protein